MIIAVFAMMNREPQPLSGHMNMVSWLLCFNDSGEGKSFDRFMLNFVIREILLKLCMTREFC